VAGPPGERAQCAGRHGVSEPVGKVGRGLRDDLGKRLEAASADAPRGCAGEHACLAVVGRDDTGRGIGAEVPLVAICLQARPVAVRDGGGRSPDTLERRAGQLGDRGPDPVRADDDPGPGPERLAVPGPAGNAGDGTVAVAVDVGHGDAEPHVGAGGEGRVDEDRVEYGAPRRVQGVHAMRRLDDDRDDGIGVAERGAAHRGRARRDDLLEQAPPGQLQHATAHQGVRGEGVGAVAAAVD
jgi:hypothetical protein